MNERRVLRLVAEVIMEALGKEDLEDTQPTPAEKLIETGSLEIPEESPVQHTQDMGTKPVVLEEVPATKPMSDLESKNKEIERLKEELSKAQMNTFNFQPVGGTNG